MRTALEIEVPQARGRTVVVPPPPPSWLIESGLKRTGRIGAENDALSIFYPASPYPHKNHKIFAGADSLPGLDWGVRQLLVTVDPNEVGMLPRCTQYLGRLTHSEVLEIYRTVDVLVFPSKLETVGFPLLEAMHVGLPVVVSDLPYARDLCGDAAVYFDPSSTTSLVRALRNVQNRLKEGWWPDWTNRLRHRPENWGDVANIMSGALQLRKRHNPCPSP